MYEFFETIALAVVNFFNGLNWANFMKSLEYMAFGLGGIFIVVGIIFLTIWLLNKIPSNSEE